MDIHAIFDQIEREGVDRVAAQPPRPETMFRRGWALSPTYAELAAKRRNVMTAARNRRRDNPPAMFFGPEPRRRPRGRISDAMRGAG